MSKDNRTADELQEARSEIKKQYFKLHRVSEDLLFHMVTSVSGTGFTVHFKNSSNASISRNFNYSAVGFGKGA